MIDMAAIIGAVNICGCQHWGWGISCAEIITEDAGLMGVLALPQNLDGKFYIFKK